MSHNKYHDIWALDEKDPLMRLAEGGESVDDVACRLAEAMEIMESQFQGFSVKEFSSVVQDRRFIQLCHGFPPVTAIRCTILVVSHGDALQILLTMLNAAKLNAGSSYTDLSSIIQAVRTPTIFSQHRNFSLLTAELRAVI